ncbi:hypothetical protein F5Y19DRAFT_455873 [Xylariaceae sp. FL1651]|nr:hypothetical protein F5Y19DRAFT_455873 [Xylariaceae sp. FL1651]
MTDHNARSLSQPNGTTQPCVGSSISRSSNSYGTHETGESSTAAAFHDASVDSTKLGRSPSYSPKVKSPELQSVEYGEQDHSHEVNQRRRSHKPRPSSGFLLSNNFLNESSKSGLQHRGDGRRKSRIPVDNRRGKSPLRSSEESDLLVPSTPNVDLGSQESANPHLAQTSNGRHNHHDDRPRSQTASRQASRIPSLRPNSAPLDVDSTQIVSMALNLSESRRLVSRRNISSPIPPRLAQLPDSTAGGSLKQHLQQQRRTSRTVSPRADRSMTPRIVSTPRINSPLHPTFDHESSYTYHFSSSTLNRAQKAKEYLELMAQFRRLLLFVPPLKQEPRSRPSTSGVPLSPISTGSPLDSHASSQNRPLGRPYNPLQYIRNRKIRTRERKAIDGEAQGFRDVPRVTDWIDEVATYTAASLLTESPKLPPFSGADECLESQPPASNLPRPVSVLNKSKRPRFDWSIDPADMLADVYWLEQGNNKYLIEDRHYTKIFTPKTEAHQPVSQASEYSKTALSTPASKEMGDSNGNDLFEHDSSLSTKADGETAVTSTRDRARQKLQDLRGMHHKHSNSVQSHHDFLRFRRGSSPDTSGSESDRRRRGRNGTISASGKDLLEKQMNEMLARETQDQQKELFAKEADIGYFKPLPTGLATPDKNSQFPNRGHSRRDSRIEAAEHLDKALPARLSQSSPIHSGRPSLEVPNQNYRSSIDLDSSRPVSPDARTRRHQSGFIPTIGMDLSPTASRPSSPARNPFSKVKNMFRDRSRERDDHTNEANDKVLSPIDPIGTPSISGVTEDVIQQSERRRSKSPAQEITQRATHESHRPHRSMGSLKLRSDEQPGLRTIFKGGAKLDGMIRGGVSKVTDFIWKKESDASSITSSDNSDIEEGRGRLRDSAMFSRRSSVRQDEDQRTAKNYLDIMPNFKSAADSVDKPSSHEIETSSGQILSLPPSRSPRFEQLKPPRIDVRKASPASSENEQNISRHFVDSDISEPDSRSRDSGRLTDWPRRTSKELHNILSMTSDDPAKPRVQGTTYGSEHRQWFIQDRNSLSQHALISRREIARLRTLILCSGIKAMEISRRANEPHPLFALDNKATGLPWTDINHFALDEQISLSVPQTELFPTTARVLSSSIQRSVKTFEKSASEFSTETAPALQKRLDKIHDRVAMDLMDMTRRAVDEADDVSHDIVDSQRLKVKSVVDTVDKMLRRRRRRFRWVRRAGWLAVEWVLVGFMWYVWFVVMIARVLLGVGRGAVSVIRWLLWF